MRIWSEKQIQSYVTEQLEKKYNEKFTFIRNANGFYNKPIRNFYFFSDSFQDAMIYVELDIKERIVSDNYVIFQKRNEICGYVKENISTVFPQNDVYQSIMDSVIPSEYCMDTPVEMMTEDPRTGLNLFVFAVDDGRNADEKIESLRKQLKRANIKGKVRICFVSSDSNIYIKNDMECSGFYSEYKGYKCTFLLDDDYNFVYVEWGNR